MQHNNNCNKDNKDKARFIKLLVIFQKRVLGPFTTESNRMSLLYLEMN